MSCLAQCHVVSHIISLRLAPSSCHFISTVVWSLLVSCHVTLMLSRDAQRHVSCRLISSRVLSSVLASTSCLTSCRLCPLACTLSSFIIIIIVILCGVTVPRGARHVSHAVTLPACHLMGCRSTSCYLFAYDVRHRVRSHRRSGFACTF